MNQPKSALSDRGIPELMRPTPAAVAAHRSARAHRAIDLALEERKARLEQQREAERLASREPETVVHRYGLGLFVALALAIAAALVGANMATDFLVGRCLWPGMSQCVPGEPIFDPTAAPDEGA